MRPLRRRTSRRVGLSSLPRRAVGPLLHPARDIDACYTSRGGCVMAAAIQTWGLAKSFGGALALRPLDLEVAEGEVLGYLGPNGAGKTTTIRCLLGFVRASAGRAEIFGVDAQAQPAEAH